MKRKLLVFAVFVAAFGDFALNAQTVTPSLTLKNSETGDQDDMCVWIHPSDPAQSTIIASDKSADMLFVYDLEGRTLQSVSDNFRPGNIDIRYRFPLAGQEADIVAFNDREKNLIRIYKVDPATRLLESVDDGTIKTVNNYGFCLYKSPKDGTFHAFVTTKNGRVQHFELFANGDKIGGKVVREWSFGSQTEGCVCDDETGQAYFGEEEKGIWKIGAEPEDGTSPQMIAKVKDASGLAKDVEGLTIYYTADGEGYLIASSQGDDKYTILERKSPHKPVGEFEVAGVTDTDGIDVINVPLNENFSQGIFLYHNGKKSPYPVGISKWEDIAGSVAGGLNIDTDYWDPSKSQTTAAPETGDSNPVGFDLGQNYPNPFNPETTIEFDLHIPAHISLTITNLLGATVRTLINGQINAGHYKTNWDGLDELGKKVATGTYLYSLKTDSRVITKKLTLIK